MLLLKQQLLNGINLIKIRVTDDSRVSGNRKKDRLSNLKKEEGENMPKVKFLEPVRQGDNVYEKGKEYTLDSETARSLGNSVKVIGKTPEESKPNSQETRQEKSVQGPQVNKMVNEPTKKK